jgi:dextranase
VEVLPRKPTFAPGEPLEIELRDLRDAATLTLLHLDAEVTRKRLRPRARYARFEPQPPGGYGLQLREDQGRHASSALDVLVDPLERPRYGFVSDFSVARDPTPIVDNARRLHLNAIQFYDWMYRHAQLLPPKDRFIDPLGRELSLATVCRLAKALDTAGSLPLGYAAVYAAGKEEWLEWRDVGLYRPDGTPWTLGEDFLWLLDPGDQHWLRHFTTQLRQAAAHVRFAGFHLDQYGDPHRALRRDGREIDLAQAFPRMIERLRRSLPHTRLIFNNVNAFPLWTTASAPQDALYIEIWPPHDRLDHLTQIIAEARRLAPRKAAILAAYQSVFARAATADALQAAQLLMATVFSHGGFLLQAGEENALLTGPYYPEHHRLRAPAYATLRRWYDFAVRYGDLFFDRGETDVTRSTIAGVNTELRIQAPASISTSLEPGAVWTRAVETDHGLVVHLINLIEQRELDWDAPKRPSEPAKNLRLSLRRVGTREPTFLFADPDRTVGLRQLRPRFESAYDHVRIPPFRTWGLVLIRRGRL